MPLCLTHLRIWLRCVVKIDEMTSLLYDLQPKLVSSKGHILSFSCDKRFLDYFAGLFLHRHFKWGEFPGDKVATSLLLHQGL